jgi:uncharacterized UBP type Zn finger protein
MTDSLRAAQNADREEFRAFALELMAPEVFTDLPEDLDREQADEIVELAAAQTILWPDSEEVFWELVVDFYGDAEIDELREYGLDEAVTALQEGETLADDEKSALAWLYILDNYPDVSTYTTLGRFIAKAVTEEEEDHIRAMAEHAIECVAVNRYPELLGEVPLFLREEPPS